jgi:hypothetical protein
LNWNLKEFDIMSKTKEAKETALSLIIKRYPALRYDSDKLTVAQAERLMIDFAELKEKALKIVLNTSERFRLEDAQESIIETTGLKKHNAELRKALKAVLDEIADVDGEPWVEIVAKLHSKSAQKLTRICKEAHNVLNKNNA